MPFVDGTRIKTVVGRSLSLSQAYIDESVKNQRCSQEGFNVSEESDTFLLGPDGRIHFTDTHLTIPNGGLDQE